MLAAAGSRRHSSGSHEAGLTIDWSGREPERAGRRTSAAVGRLTRASDDISDHPEAAAIRTCIAIAGRPMRITQLALVSALFACAAGASAPDTATVEQFVEGILTLTASQCAQMDDSLVRQFEREGKAVEAYQMRSGMHMLCTCIPEQLRDLQKKLPNEMKDERLTQAEFADKHYSRALGACAAEQQRATYGGDCSNRYSKVVPNAATYCACMSGGLQGFSEAELVQVGNEASDWVPRAAEAKKRGLAAPEQSPLLARYLGLESSCRSK